MGKFELGQVYTTRAVHEYAEKHQTICPWLCDCLARHMHGDWGDLCEADKLTNEQALKNGDRLMSAYKGDALNWPTVWIITEADRSTTTILFPEDY